VLAPIPQKPVDDVPRVGFRRGRGEPGLGLRRRLKRRWLKRGLRNRTTFLDHDGLGRARRTRDGIAAKPIGSRRDVVCVLSHRRLRASPASHAREDRVIGAPGCQHLHDCSDEQESYAKIIAPHTPRR